MVQLDGENHPHMQLPNKQISDSYLITKHHSGIDRAQNVQVSTEPLRYGGGGMYTYRVYEVRNSTNSASPSIMKNRQPKSIIIQKKKIAEKR